MFSFACFGIDLVFLSGQWAAGLGLHVAGVDGGRRGGVYHLPGSTGLSLGVFPRLGSVPRM